MKIREKILFALLLVGIAPILISFIVSASVVLSRSKNDARRSIKQDLENFKQTIYLDMDQQGTYSSFFSRNIQIKLSGKTPSAKINFLMTSLPFDIRLLEISARDHLVRREFSTTAAAKYVTRQTEISNIWSVLSRPLYHRYFVMPFPSVINKTMVIRNASIIVDPINDEKKGLTIVSLIFDSKYLSKLTRNYPDVILFSEVDQNLSFSQPLPHFNQLSNILSLSNQSLSQVHIPKKGIFYVYKDKLLKLTDGDLAKIGILYRSNSINKTLALFKQIAVIVFILNTLIAGLISFLFAKRISVPISDLTNEVSLFKETFKPVSLPKDTKDEIGILHQTFSEMTEKIIFHQDNIEEYNNRLTNEVQEKTHDLLSKIRGLSLMNELSSILIKENEIEENALLKKITLEINNLIKLRYIAILDPQKEQSTCVGYEYDVSRFPSNSSLQKMQRIRTYFSEKVFSTEQPFERTFKDESFLCYPIYFVDHIAFTLFVVIEKRKREFFHEISSTLTNMISMKIYSLRLGQEKIQSEKLASIGQFAGTIIHDIKNPLTVIKSYVEVLVDDDFSQEEKLNYKDRLLIEIERLTDMLNEILDYSKGDLVLYKQETDLDAFVEKILQFYHRSLKEKDIHLNLDLNSHSVIPLDQNRMQRSIGNIVNNAIDALNESGTLTVRSVKKAFNVMLIIEDNGSGIPEDLQSQIFTPFVTHGKKDGTGLGLSITKKIIENHGGNITFKSSQGKGTSFYISLPF